MMISLFRTIGGGTLEYRTIVERSGRLVTRRMSYRAGGAAVGGPEDGLGAVGSPSGDRAARALLRRALAEGYRVLYAFVPPDGAPRTHGFLNALKDVEVQPDPRDGVPVWSPGSRARGGKPSYLLFTTFSSEAK